MPIENIESKNPDGKWLYLQCQSNSSTAIAKVIDKLLLLKISRVPILFLLRLRGGKAYRLSKLFLQMRLRRIAIAFTLDSDKDKQPYNHFRFLHYFSLFNQISVALAFPMASKITKIRAETERIRHVD